MVSNYILFNALKSWIIKKEHLNHSQPQIDLIENSQLTEIQRGVIISFILENSTKNI
jgi:hypothetical protein